MDQVSLKTIADFSAANLEVWIFYLLAGLAIPFAYGILLDRRIIRSGFLLIGVFGAISGLFMLLQAQFLAMAQLMIYAVGITLVVVIALMLTNPRLEHDISPASQVHKLPGVLVAALLFITIYLSLRSEIWPVSTEPMAPDNVLLIGTELLTYYSLPFEFASILLLVALIGAVMLAKADRIVPTRSEDWIETDEEPYTERRDDVVKV